MSAVDFKRELQSFLQQEKTQECKATVMPDFFLDRFVTLDWDVTKFSECLADVAKRKGGSIDGISQIDMRGGNAVNVASALTGLDAKVTPIVCTSEYGLNQIKYRSKKDKLDASHIKTTCKASITTALEFQAQNGKTNVMLRDLGGLADFGPANLNDSDWALIEASDYVCVFNWAGTVKHGTALAKAVFERAHNGRAKTYYDTADPNPNAKGIADLLTKVLKTDLVDILSLNENEAITYASLMDESLKEKKERLSFAELAMVAARVLAQHLSARIDLHATSFSASLKGKSEIIMPTFKVKVLRATGAGDAWNAGNILGDKYGLKVECRLMLANAVSACYLSDPKGLHPTKAKLAKFLNDNS